MRLSCLPFLLFISSFFVHSQDLHAQECIQISLLIDENGSYQDVELPDITQVLPGAEYTSDCISLVKADNWFSANSATGIEISVNAGEFTDKPVIFKEGDIIQFKGKAPDSFEASETIRTSLNFLYNSASTQKRMYMRFTVNTQKNRSTSAACLDADLTLSNRGSVNGFELPAYLDAVPGSDVESQCLLFSNLNGNTVLVEPYRDEQLLINNGVLSTEPYQITEGDTVRIRSIASLTQGKSLKPRMRLTMNPESSAPLNAFYSWRVVTEHAELDGGGCYKTEDIVDSSTLYLPYKSEPEEGGWLYSECIQLQSRASIESSDRNLKISVNDGSIVDFPQRLTRSDFFRLVQTSDLPAVTRLYKNTINFSVSTNHPNNTLKTEWLTVNQDFGDDDSGTDPGPNPGPSPGVPPEEFPIEASLSHFENCRTSDFSIRTNGKRKLVHAVLPNVVGAGVGEALVSNCRELSGFEVPVVVTNKKNVWFSVNGEPFTQGEQTLDNGDQIVIGFISSTEFGKSQTARIKVTPSENAISEATFHLNWGVQTMNTSREPREWQVGKSREYKQIEQISHMLVAGDVVNIDGDATYEPFILEGISGTKEKPIRFVGISKNGKRPQFHGSHSRWPWTVGFRYSHNIEVENVEISGADTICLRHESDNLTLKHVYIHDCKIHGILGTDTNSGSLQIIQSEVSHSGGKLEDRPWGHPVYVATDQYRFPGSRLHIAHSFFHNNKGNTIKSRAERVEFYYNWVELSELDQARFALELIGPGVQTEQPIQQDIVGNVFWLDKDFYAIRAGSDGTGGSDGILRIAHNTIVHANENNSQSLIRLDAAMSGLAIENNLITQRSANDSYSFLRDGITLEKWLLNYDHIYMSSNVLPTQPTINTTNDSSRKRALEDYLGPERWLMNTTVNQVDGVTINFESKSIQVSAQSNLLQGQTENLEVFYELFEFVSPLNYLEGIYAAPSERPIPGEIIDRHAKVPGITIGGF